MCHLIRHVKPGVCLGSKMENDDNDEISPIIYSEERARRIDRRIKMNTPIVLENDIDVNSLKRKMLSSLNGPSLEQLPKRNPNSNENHLHLYNPPTISQQTKDIFEDGGNDCYAVDDELQSRESDNAPVEKERILPKSVSVNVPPSLKAQIHLANILSSHNVDLSLFNDITDWLKHHANSGDIDWSGSHWMKRGPMLNRMEEVLQLQGMRPKNLDVRLSSTGSKLTVPVFDFTSMALSMLHDPTIMQKGNIIPDFDLHTGKKHPYARNDKYDDLTSGSLYEDAYKLYVTGLDDMPIPIYVFIDETFTDLYGSLKVAPVIFTFAFFTQECRNNVDFWRPLGFVPNLGYGKSKNDKTASRLKLQDFHDVLKAIFQSYIDVHANGGIKTVITDFCGGWKNVTLKSWIHVVIGDTCGNNQLCGHYNTNGMNVTRPYRDCECCGKNMSNAHPFCVLINREDIIELEKDDEICDSKTGAMPTLSKYKIDNVFDHIPISHPKAGIYRLTPPEGLHVFGNGIYANFFQVIHDIFGTNSSGKTEKEEIETLHNVISADFGRQSESEFPRRSSRNGPLDGTKMGATERRGNLFAFVVTMLTFQGKTILDEKLSSNSSGRKIEYSKFIETILLTLSFEKWLHDENLKTEVDEAGPWVAKLKELIKEHLDKEAIEKKGNGWDTPKFHAMSKFLYYISLFGCATNFFGGPCESALKKIIKNPGRHTQRRAYSFCSQVATRNFENFILELAWELVRESCGDPRLATKCHNRNEDTPNNDSANDGNTAEDEAAENNEDAHPPSADTNDTDEDLEDNITDQDSVVQVENNDDDDPSCHRARRPSQQSPIQASWP